MPEKNEGSGDVVLSVRVEALQDLPDDKIRLAREYVTNINDFTDGNIMYQRCFMILKLGGLEAEMPRLVVFGQQSMGKTTLLDMIMGGPIGYSSTDTGTKQPVVIMLRPNDNPAIVGSSNDDAIECTLKGQSMKIRDLQKEMKKIMSSAKSISSEELELEIALPEGVHAVFVDLPGIKDDSKEGAELTRTVVRNYVQNNPNDLYILVKKASDDPANWPYSLREFILSSQPSGLGLTTKQTMVVGTRAKDFLQAEMNDVRTLQELQQRVLKRAVRDHEGTPLPLYLLELFSLSISDKDEGDFGYRKRRMDEQIEAGKRQCMAMLSSGFQSDSKLKASDLERYFDPQIFRKDLNSKFQSLLTDQLSTLEKRLIKKRNDVLRDIRRKESELRSHNSATIRESIHAFISEFSRIVTDLVTGDFRIMRLEDGNRWLCEFGGTLEDNLRDGHELAMELYDSTKYDPTFLDSMKVLADRAMKKMSARRAMERSKKEKVLETLRLKKKDAETEAEDEAKEQEKETVNVRNSLRVNLPSPDRTGEMFPGQFVRFTIKDGSQMLGFIKAYEDNSPSVAFTWRQTSAANSSQQTEQEQDRPVSDKSKLDVVVPLSLAINPTNNPSKSFLAWRKVYRADNWKGVEAVLVKQVTNLHPIANPWISDVSAQPSQASTLFDGDASVSPLINFDLKTVVKAMRESGPDPLSNQTPMQLIQVDETQNIQVPAVELFLDAEVVNQEGGQWNAMTPLQRIAGEFAETKLLNQLSLTYLGRWMKFHIAHLEPDQRLSENVLLQMMRSVKRVVDKADWEPLVADLLQINVQRGLLQLARLAACATSVALRRILLAGLHEMKRRATAGELFSNISFLVKCPRFLDDLETSLETYCRDRAQYCAQDMQHMILDQTEAIHFEEISDIFEGCRQFETEFIGSNSMSTITDEVNRQLELRKDELRKAEVYARGSKALTSQEMIYQEVRVHFWVVKLLLSAPMTTKLYVCFIKDIKDKSPHLAAEPQSYGQDTTLEHALENSVLYQIDTEGEPAQRSEEELMQHYEFNFNTIAVKREVTGLRRVAEYVQLALACVARLRNMINQGQGVDFLTRLEHLSPPSTRTPTPSVPTPPLPGAPYVTTRITSYPQSTYSSVVNSGANSVFRTRAENDGRPDASVWDTARQLA